MYKSVLSVFIAVLAMFFQYGASASNSNGCYWLTEFAPVFKQINIAPPSSVMLRDGPVGSVLLVVGPFEVWQQPYGEKVTCSGIRLTESLKLTNGMRLAEGFDNVYETGVQGIGLRFSTYRFSEYIPYEISHPKALIVPYRNIFYEFVRTGPVVKDGLATINATFSHVLMGDWHTSDLLVSGTIKIENERRITSCVNIGDTLVRMGRVDASEVGRRAGRDFLLEAQCAHEGTPGQPLPVKVYFEGSSPGPGRLNLVAGGAQGIEISLTDDTGKPLPFEKTNALNMVSPDETSGKYTLRANAVYVKKQSEKIVPGQANATLNYIFEYN